MEKTNRANNKAAKRERKRLADQGAAQASKAAFVQALSSQSVFVSLLLLFVPLPPSPLPPRSRCVVRVN